MAALTLECPKCLKFFLEFNIKRQASIAKNHELHACLPLCPECQDKATRDSQIFLKNHTKASGALLREICIRDGLIKPREKIR